MKAVSIVGTIGLLLATSSVHAQVSGHIASLQVGSEILYGQEFAFDFSQAVVAADVQCMNNFDGMPKGCPFGPGRFPSPTSHTCDGGQVVACEGQHYIRKWITNDMWVGHKDRFLGPPAPRFRLDFARGWITDVSYSYFDANGLHGGTAWNIFGSYPLESRSPEAMITGFASHVRPAFARGTVVADWDGGTGSPIPVMTLVLEQFGSGGWTPVAQVTSSASGSPATYEISGFVEPTADVRVRIQFLSFNAIVRDVRLFVEQCIPDASRPGQCLGDP